LPIVLVLNNRYKNLNCYWDEKFEKTGGLLLSAIRKGYDANGLNKPGKLISESRHFNIILDKEFPADHFKIKDGK